jgi:CheY-like chemotaxis protein
LRLKGANVHVRYDAAHAIAAAEALAPELVIMDIGMPEMDGHEACQLMRQQPWGRALILVALTGWGEQKDADRARESGFNAHLVKPVKPPELVDQLDLLLSGRSSSP